MTSSNGQTLKTYGCKSDWPFEAKFLSTSSWSLAQYCWMKCQNTIVYVDCFSFYQQSIVFSALLWHSFAALFILSVRYWSQDATTTRSVAKMYLPSQLEMPVVEWPLLVKQTSTLDARKEKFVLQVSKCVRQSHSLANVLLITFATKH